MSFLRWLYHVIRWRMEAHSFFVVEGIPAMYGHLGNICLYKGVNPQEAFNPHMWQGDWSNGVIIYEISYNPRTRTTREEKKSYRPDEIQTGRWSPLLG